MSIELVKFISPYSCRVLRLVLIWIFRLIEFFLVKEIELMLPDLTIHQLTNENENEWFTCADINDKQEIICGTDQGIIYQTQPSGNEHKSTYKQLIG